MRRDAKRGVGVGFLVLEWFTMERSLKPQESSLTKRNGAHENVFNGKRAGVRACVRVFDDGECRRAAASSRVFFHFIPFAAVAAAG
jgi:hypothetical protein